jgi:hypothetical protein
VHEGLRWRTVDLRSGGEGGIVGERLHGIVVCTIDVDVFLDSLR